MSTESQPGRRRRAAAVERELAFLDSFLATSIRMHNGNPEHDVLAGLKQARRWAAIALDERAQRNGIELGDIFLEEHDLEPLRAFREDLRMSLAANRSEPVEYASRIVTTVDVHWSADGRLGFRPTGSGWRGIVGVLTMDLLLTQASGRLRRLKTCAHPPCGYPFVDHSPNLTRAWHDTARCGNVVNLRASRARRRAGPTSS